ncbi:MAG: 50S ribosomal protein L7/L12 [Pirellulaceae bacterium]|jgi:large subunit ribosomal protein L7/L12|nr:50S ribosomal protein L7/L12 [Pirellulaceae bacterium]MDP7018504.1 50S ribosomal protein L7/L12 [Pirellulaceae bacterium]
MSDEAATVEVDAELKTLGDQIADLTLKQAKELSDYLKDAYNIEPASGGAVIMAPTDGGGAAEEAVQTEFDVVMTGFGDNKVKVIKEVRSITGLSLIEAKKTVEASPAKIKEGVDEEEANKLKAQLEEAGASVELQ